MKKDSNDVNETKEKIHVGQTQLPVCQCFKVAENNKSRWWQDNKYMEDKWPLVFANFLFDFIVLAF